MAALSRLVCWVLEWVSEKKKGRVFAVLRWGLFGGFFGFFVFADAQLGGEYLFGGKQP